MTAPVQTQGPVDPNAGLRAKLYATLTALLGIPGVIQIFGAITADQSASITKILTGVLGLVGGGGFALAATKTSQQAKNGTFDPAPPPAPAVVAVDGIKAVVDQVTNLNDAVAEGMQRMQDIAGVLPTLSQLTQLGPLAQAVMNQGRPQQ